ncbi:MAG: large conductance mechanosensitive channel protein MscL [Ruminiclostridium sp.]|nr:large conductance mechanosensitive channel protein MscL [Ruminiclostridium sp.]
MADEKAKAAAAAAAEKGKGFLKEFKEFALKGNVMDMAVGVLIGGAFSGIVTALTNDFINPLISSIGGAEIAGMIRLPWVNYEGLDADQIKALSLDYGEFITTVINFLIMALIIFLLMKGINKLMSLGKKKAEEEAAAAPPPEPSKEEVLLTEIRDLLAAQNGGKSKKE